MKLTGESRSTRRETCCATLPNTNPTWTDPGPNPGPRGDRPAANRMSHGTANMKESLSFELSLSIYYLTQCNFPEDLNLQQKWFIPNCIVFHSSHNTILQYFR